jgi:hypothetical protein
MDDVGQNTHIVAVKPFDALSVTHGYRQFRASAGHAPHA